MSRSPVRYLLLMLVLVAGFACAVPNAPLEVVRSTADRVLDKVVKEREELNRSPGKIYDLVNDLVLPHFDFDYMSQLVLGVHWRRATADQKKMFTAEFQEILVRTYATALLNYSGQKIDYLPLRQSPGASDVKVNTRVSEPGAPPIPVDYSLRLSNGVWQVYDVSIDNVSLVSQYRTSYSSEIKRFKMDGLIDRMKMLNKRNR